MKKLILGLTVAAISGAASHAGLIGSTVSSTLTVSGVSAQFTPPTATVSSLLPEFTYSNGLSLETVDITASQICLNVISLLVSPSLKITLTDPSFAGLLLNETSDNFLGGATATISGTTITITAPAQKSGNFTAKYSFASGSTTRVPDGGSTLVMVLGGMGLMAANRVRKA